MPLDNSRSAAWSQSSTQPNGEPLPSALEMTLPEMEKHGKPIAPSEIPRTEQYQAQGSMSPRVQSARRRSRAPSQSEGGEKSEWKLKLLLVLCKDRDARIGFLAATLAVFLIAYSVVFLVYSYTAPVDPDTAWAHRQPWCITMAVAGVALVPTVYSVVRPLLSNTAEYEELTFDDTTLVLESEAQALTDVARPPGRSGRNFKLDYLKLIVNVIVVAYHSLDTIHCSQFYHSDLAYRFYNSLVQPFMMPAMVLLSGYVYSPELVPRRVHAIFQFACGYVVLQILYLAVLKLTLVAKTPADVVGTRCFGVTPSLTNQPAEVVGHADVLPWYKVIGDLPKPFYHLWYLHALVAWRIMSPFWMQLRYPLIASLLLSTLAAFIDVDSQALYRITGMLPFFVLGASLKPFDRHLMRLLSKPESKVFGVAICLVNVVIAVRVTHEYVCDEYFARVCGLRSAPCTAGLDRAGPFWLEVPKLETYWIGMWALLATYLVALPLTFGVMALMPESDIPLLRTLGERTLVPYIFHIFPLILFRAYTSFTVDHKVKHIVPLFICMVVATSLWYHPLVQRVCLCLVDVPLVRMGLFKPVRNN